MKRKAIARILALLALVASHDGTLLASAEPEPDLTKGRARLTQLQKPKHRGAPPEALVRSGRTDRTADRRAQRSRPQAGAMNRRAIAELSDPLHELARIEGAWTAERLIYERGEREYYRVGFFEGLQASFRDPAVGRWDYRSGRRRGSLDPEATSYGIGLGRVAAADSAREAAGRRVEAQFLDLRNEPLRDPNPIPSASYHGGAPAVERPTLRAVFREYPVSAVIIPAPRFLADWEYDGWQLYECPGYGQFYESWTDSGEAFGFWLAQRTRSEIWHSGLSDSERGRFTESFRSAFVDRLDRLYDRHLLVAHGDGFDDGWGYGALVRGELEYRNGYRDGFRLAVGDAASAAFERDFPRRFVEAYDEQFEEWSRTSRPVIGETYLRDGDDDGVFQPGEALQVEFELINYGGAASVLPVRLEGDALEATAVDRVSLPRRSVTRAALPLSARVRPDLTVPVATALELSAADQSVTLPLNIEFPLRLLRHTLHTDRDNLAGEVRIEVAVENRSGRERPGAVTLTAQGFSDERFFEALGPGERLTIRFEVHGLHPMDLISGRVSLDLRLSGAGIEQDRLIHRLTEVARDLGNRDLLLYMRNLAERGGATREEIASARGWLLARLREDWGAAARGRGNPYKYDYRRQETRTALGDLVQSYLLAQDRMVQPDVYAGLSAEIMTLAGVLPGIHPFLRKYARRLASRLP